MKTLSICIPSYDRFEKLSGTVRNILECKADDFEVVIIDNCSPRDINIFMPHDPRLRIVKREKAVYGAKNVGDAVLFADAEFALLLLDKDTIDGQELEIFINTLRTNVDITGGYCQLNSTGDSYDISEACNIEKFGYLSKHPSGDFYKISILRDYMLYKEDILEKDPFPFDIYLAYCASKGRMMYYDRPLVCSELNNPKEKDSGTLTFKKNVGNIYYFPENRIAEFKVYAACLADLQIDEEIKVKTLSTVYYHSIMNVTLVLRDLMKNELVCHHYGHEAENIGLVDMIKNVLILRTTLLGIDEFTLVEKKKVIRESRKCVLKKIYEKVINKNE